MMKDKIVILDRFEALRCKNLSTTIKQAFCAECTTSVTNLLDANLRTNWIRNKFQISNSV